jgi:hypothetical protein
MAEKLLCDGRRQAGELSFRLVWGRLGIAIALVLGILVDRGLGREARPSKVAVTFFVSPDGNDQAPGTESAPFRTLSRAQEAIRQWKRKQLTEGDIVVLLGGGVYELSQPLRFGPEDSGTDQFRIIYRAAGEEVILSGGRGITGWQELENGVWKAPCPLKPFRQLYVGERRAVRARSGSLGENPDPGKWEFLQDYARGGELPDAEFLHAEGFSSSALEMAQWRRPNDLELVFVNVWSHMRYKVRELRREGETLVILMRQPEFLHGRFKEGMPVNLPAWVENALELLDEPGEWYWDAGGQIIFYKPRPGENLTAVPVIAPQLERLLIVEGTADRPVRNIRFEGITFAYSNWSRPNDVGHADVQANFTLDSTSDRLLVRKGGYFMLHNECVKSPGAVVLRYAQGIEFERCTFTRLGSAGLDIERGSRGNLVSGCHFYDISGTAIQIGDVQKEDHHPEDPRDIVAHNRVANCLIHDCALEYMGGVGIFVGYTTRTEIVHNEICRLPYTGISVGWGWGEEDAGGGAYWQPFFYDTPTPSRENFIAYNHIHHIMRPMQDGGGIYTLGNQPGTRIVANYIHHATGVPGGIYLDEGSGFIEVTENLIHDVATPLNFNNRAQDRISTCKVHKNFTYRSRPKKLPPDAERIMSLAGLEGPYENLLIHLPDTED